MIENAPSSPINAKMRGETTWIPANASACVSSAGRTSSASASFFARRPHNCPLIEQQKPGSLALGDG